MRANPLLMTVLGNPRPGRFDPMSGQVRGKRYVLGTLPSGTWIHDPEGWLTYCQVVRHKDGKTVVKKLDGRLKAISSSYKVHIHASRNPGGLRPKSAKIFCVMCGDWTKKGDPYRRPKVGPQKGKIICDLCYRGWRSGRRSGASWAQNGGRKYQENPFVLVDSATLKIIRNWKGSMMDRKPWSWAQEAARRLNRDVFVVAHPYVPKGFKAGVEVSPLFFSGGPFQVVSPDGGSRQGDWSDLPAQSNPSVGASLIGGMTGALVTHALSNPMPNPLTGRERNRVYTEAKNSHILGCRAAERKDVEELRRYTTKIGGMADAAEAMGDHKLYIEISLLAGDLHEAGAQAGLWQTYSHGHRSLPKQSLPDPEETAGGFRRLNPRGPSEPDEHAARELQLFIDNDSNLYHQRFIPMVKNLMKKRAAGIYDSEKAAKLFLYLADDGARKYYKEFGGSFKFDLATRWAVAKSIRDGFEAEAELGNYDSLTFGVSNNPLTIRESADVLRDARNELRYGRSFSPGFTRSESAGQAMGRAKVVRKYGPRRAGRAAMRIADRAQRVAGTPFSNPGPGVGSRKVTMPIERFAKIVRAQRDPALWKDFVAKCKAYHKWSHGTWPRKVTVEPIRKAGMKGIWIAFDMGKEPEKTYIMPGGTKRKGAWKHPWERMPQLRGDAEAGMIITKLGKGNRLTDFLHG